MTNKLQMYAREVSSHKLTENGAFAYNTTNDALLDLFATAGALRPRPEYQIIEKFNKAFNESPLLATKMLFYIGNIRGGLGERRTFKICLKWLAENYPEIMIKNISLIPFYNRWDSVFQLIDTPVEKEMWDLVKTQLYEDNMNAINHKPISLLAKWLPSENASSKETKKLAYKVMSELGFQPRRYRKTLSYLREYLRITERDMSANNWESINYEAVPSKAMLNYREAFVRHDKERFNEYLASLRTGEKKINAKTLFPYELVKNYWNYNEVIEAQWKALPNYVTDESNILIMADVSGSMCGRPMDTSIGLATYFAERNNGPLKGVYMTFTDNPHFIYLDEEDTLATKIRKVRNTDVGYNTDLEKAFDYLLKVAVKNNFSEEDMPKALVVISDMEIDHYVSYYGLDFVGEQVVKYANAGFNLPKLILWNVESRQDTFLTKDKNVIMVSGQSPSTFKNLLAGVEGKTSWDVLLETLLDPMYEMVTI